MNKPIKKIPPQQALDLVPIIEQLLKSIMDVADVTIILDVDIDKL